MANPQKEARILEAESKPQQWSRQRSDRGSVKSAHFS